MTSHQIGYSHGRVARCAVGLLAALLHVAFLAALVWAIADFLSNIFPVIR